MQTPPRLSPAIGIVGICAAGKSTLIQRLKLKGISASHIAQEHSHVQDMWKRISNPKVLIFLDATFSVVQQRRQQNYTKEDYLEQQRRLAHARAHADLFLNTDDLTPDEVASQVIQFLESQKFNS